MGCGGSKEGEDKQIEYYMEWVPSYDYNTFFSSGENVLRKAEHIRHGLEDTAEYMFDVTAVCYLLSPPNLMDAVKVFLWTMSANNGGDISKCKVSATSSAPYFDAYIPSYSSPQLYQLYKFKENLKDYIEVCITAPQDVPKLIEELNRLIEKGNTLKDNASSALSHLGAVEKVKAIAKIAKNISKLSTGVNKLKNLQPLIPLAVSNMQVVLKEFLNEHDAADEKGKQAIAKKLVFACDIMQQLHPGQKHTEEEIKVLKENAEKKRKEQEEAKRKKEDLVEQMKEARKKLDETLKK